MNNNEYIRLSLELHIFFSRIMKEHSFFIEAAFTDKNNNLKKVAREFQNSFSNILKEVIYLSNGRINTNFLNSNEIVTKDTLESEKITSELSGIPIDSNITKQELNLRSGQISSNEEILNRVSSINKKTLPLIENLIAFKSEILKNVLECKLYTFNYPLLITHIMNEAKMYYLLLNKIERKTKLTEKEFNEQELFWNNIMKEHAEFIRGLLDPTEEELITTADKYAKDYKAIIKNYNNNPDYFNKLSLDETLNFKLFKLAGVEGLLNCKIKSIIIPLLADHILREANHFIRILESAKK